MAIDALMSASTNDYSVQFVPIFDWGQSDFNFNVPVQMNGKTVLRHNDSANNLVVSSSGGFIYFRPGGTNDTSSEMRLNPRGSLEITGDIIIGGKSLLEALRAANVSI
jgi:hypothetical protein